MLHVTYLNEKDETSTLEIDAEGKTDYSALAEGTYQIIVTADAEQISEFELRIAESSSEPEQPGNDKPDKPDDENDGQTENKDKSNTSTLTILFVLLGVLAVCGIAVFIAMKRKNKNEKK